LLQVVAEEQSIVTSSVSAFSAKAVSVHENIEAQAMIADIATDKNFFIFLFPFKFLYNIILHKT